MPFLASFNKLSLQYPQHDDEYEGGLSEDEWSEDEWDELEGKSEYK